MVIVFSLFPCVFPCTRENVAQQQSRKAIGVPLRTIFFSAPPRFHSAATNLRKFPQNSELLPAQSMEHRDLSAEARRAQAEGGSGQAHKPSNSILPFPAYFPAPGKKALLRFARA
jgi:hypothetical protein